MAGYAIGLEVIGSLGEQNVGFRLAAGTRNPGFRIRNQVIDINATSFNQRQEAQLYRCRITPGVRDQPCSHDLCTVQFRQAIDGFGNKIRRSVRHPIPLFPDSNILDPEVCRQINHAYAGIEQVAGLLHRHAVRGREKDDLTIL